ncbi:hypothetical protein [Azonexus hydrophilus]|uniref:Uncharacterized protein n=1 Tax=Azonexus hydrophilus TaxID=418702 RepID=A0ABZ2XLB0_9RHOO
MPSEPILAAKRGPENYRYLPNPAKCAIEFLDAQADRSIEKLDKYLDHYFTVTGQVCEEHTRYSCHYIAVKRFALTGESIAGSLYVPQ